MSQDYTKIEGKLQKLLSVLDGDIEVEALKFLKTKHPDHKEKVEGFIESNDYSSAIDGNLYIILNECLYLIEYTSHDVETHCVYTNPSEDGTLTFSATYCLNDYNLVELLEDEVYND